MLVQCFLSIKLKIKQHTPLLVKAKLFTGLYHIRKYKVKKKSRWGSLASYNEDLRASALQRKSVLLSRGLLGI